MLVDGFCPQTWYLGPRNIFGASDVCGGIQLRAPGKCEVCSSALIVAFSGGF